MNDEEPQISGYDPPVRASSDVGARDAVTEASRYLSIKRDELQRQIGEIESFLGFAQQADELAVRIAKIESFIGFKG